MALRPIGVLLLCLSLTIVAIAGLFASGELANRLGFGPSDSPGVQNGQQICDRLTPVQLEDITGVPWYRGEANPQPGTLIDRINIEKSCEIHRQLRPSTDGHAEGVLVVKVILARSSAEASRNVDRAVNSKPGVPPVRLENVSGLGDKATWSPEKNYLGVVKGKRGYLIYLASALGYGILRDACIKIVQLVMS